MLGSGVRVYVVLSGISCGGNGDCLVIPLEAASSRRIKPGTKYRRWVKPSARVPLRFGRLPLATPASGLGGRTFAQNTGKPKGKLTVGCCRLGSANMLGGKNHLLYARRKKSPLLRTDPLTLDHSCGNDHKYTQLWVTIHAQKATWPLDMGVSSYQKAAPVSEVAFP